MESRQFSIGFKSIRIVFFERGLSSASSNQIEQMFQQTEQRKPLSPFQTPSPFHSRLKERFSVSVLKDYFYYRIVVWYIFRVNGLLSMFSLKYYTFCSYQAYDVRWFILKSVILWGHYSRYVTILPQVRWYSQRDWLPIIMLAWCDWCHHWHWVWCEDTGLPAPAHTGPEPEAGVRAREEWAGPRPGGGGQCQRPTKA